MNGLTETGILGEKHRGPRNNRKQKLEGGIIRAGLGVRVKECEQGLPGMQEQAVTTAQQSFIV